MSHISQKTLENHRDLPLVIMAIFSDVKMDDVHLNDVMIEIRAELGVDRKFTRDVRAEVENEAVQWAILEGFKFVDVDNEENRYSFVALAKGSRGTKLSLIVADFSADLIKEFLSTGEVVTNKDESSKRSLLWCCSSDKNRKRGEEEEEKVNLEVTSQEVLHMCRAIVVNKLIAKGVFIKKKF